MRSGFYQSGKNPERPTYNYRCKECSLRLQKARRRSGPQKSEDGVYITHYDGQPVVGPPPISQNIAKTKANEIERARNRSINRLINSWSPPR